MKLLSRILTAAVLIALAVTAGVWLARPPLAAATARQTKIVSEPAEAPLPIPAPIPAVPVVRPTTPILSKCRWKWKSPWRPPSRNLRRP